MLADRPACYYGHREVVEYLLTSPEIIQTGGTHAKVQSSSATARMQAGFCAPPADEKGCALLQAVLGHHLHIVKFLLASEHIFEKNGQSFSQPDKEKALEVAFIRNYTDIVNFMIFEYDIEYSSGLQEIAQHPDFQEIKTLFQRRELHEELQANLQIRQEGKPSRARKI